MTQFPYSKNIKMKHQRIQLPNGKTGILLVDDDDTNHHPNQYNSNEIHRRDHFSSNDGQYSYMSYQSHYRSPQASNECH